METLHTWWATELYPMRERDQFGVSGEFEVVLAADAQATIAALQARVQELEEWQRIVTGTGTDQESVIRLAAHEYTKAAIQCWKEANEKLTADLTQRTAELEAASKAIAEWRKEIDSVLDKLDDREGDVVALQAELERVRGELASYKEVRP